MKKPDLIVLSHGGGVQTQTIAEMIVLGEIPKPDAAIFADTGDEPAYVYKQVEYVKERLGTVGVPLIVVSNGNLHDDVYGGGRFAAMPLFTKLARAKKRRSGKKKVTQDNSLFPLSDYDDDSYDEFGETSGFGVSAQVLETGRMKRQCTYDYKIAPIDHELRVMLLEMKLAKQRKDGSIVSLRQALVENWIGYTLDEVERIKPARHNWQRFAYPLIDRRMYKSDCISWLESNGLPIPLSSNCRKCPVISNSRALQMMANDPAGYENRLQFDRDLRNGTLRIAASAKGKLFVSPQLIPLEEVDILAPDQPSLLTCQNSICMT